MNDLGAKDNNVRTTALDDIQVQYNTKIPTPNIIPYADCNGRSLSKLCSREKSLRAPPAPPSRLRNQACVAPESKEIAPRGRVMRGVFMPVIERVCRRTCPCRAEAVCNLVRKRFHVWLDGADWLDGAVFFHFEFGR